jgi:phage terminase large subunit-like protein
MKKMVEAAAKRKKQNYADLLFIMANSVLNDKWKEVYDAMIGEKKQSENKIDKLEKIFSSIPGMRGT